MLNRQTSSADLSDKDWECFLSVGFSNHREIIRKTSTLEERLFYIRRCAKEFWNVETTKYHLKIVELSFSDTSKPMGVSTYRTSQELPERFRKALPSIDDLKMLL